MKYYVIEPEVAGGWGDNIVVADRSVHPPSISRLHYEFHGWPSDVLLKGFGVYIVTREAMKKIQIINATGASFDKVEVSTSATFEAFQKLHTGSKLPEFVWLKVVGQAGYDDFGIIPYRNINSISYPELRLVISERVLDVLRPMGLAYAVVNEYVK